MDIQSRKVNYSRDSQRIKNPDDTVEETLSNLESRFDVSTETLKHDVAPGLECAVIEGEKPLYWKSRTTTRGKGLTSKQSLASALGEYVERYAGTRFIEERTESDQESSNEKLFLEDLLPPLEEASKCKNEQLGLYPSMLGDTCPLKKGKWPTRLYRLLANDNCGCWRGLNRWEVALGFGGDIQDAMKLSAHDDWMEYYSLKDGKKYDLPFAYMTISTNGLASGNCKEEAALHGITEVIERDEAFREFKAVDVDNLEDKNFIRTEELPSEIRERFDEGSLDKFIITHSRSELCPKVHVFQVMAVYEPNTRNFVSPDIEVFCGRGANLNPRYALQRAITETFQGISSYKVKEILKPDPDFERNYRSLEELENNSNGDFKEDIRTVTKNLKEDSNIFLREIPADDFNLDVIKCVISNAHGAPIQKIEQDFYEEVMGRDLNIIEKQGIKFSTING